MRKALRDLYIVYIKNHITQKMFEDYYGLGNDIPMSIDFEEINDKDLEDLCDYVLEQRQIMRNERIKKEIGDE